MAKLSPKDKEEILKALARNVKASELAKKYDVSNATITKIKKSKSEILESKKKTFEKVKSKKKVKSKIKSELTIKQQKFVDNYVKTGNATQSAKDSGYSERSAHDIGKENLRKPLVKKAIDEQMRELEDDSIMSAIEILELYSNIARGVECEEIVTDAGVETVKPKIIDRIRASAELGKRYNLNHSVVEIETKELQKTKLDAEISKLKVELELLEQRKALLSKVDESGQLNNLIDAFRVIGDNDE